MLIVYCVFSVFCWYIMSVAALDFFKSTPVDPVDVGAFETACGVGVVITPEQISEQVWFI